MTEQDDFLQSVGMRTNVSKTELIYFSRNAIVPQDLTVKGTTVGPSDTMKILCIKFGRNMNWEAHLNTVKKEGIFCNQQAEILVQIH